jgi:hypothetical protein
MFSKILRDFLVILVAVSCTHMDPKASSWSELDNFESQKCVKLSPFKNTESLGIKSFRFVKDGDEELILVNHFTRLGELESRIGVWQDLEAEPKWLYTIKKNVLGFLGRNQFIEVHQAGIDLIQGHQRLSIFKGNFDILPELISISKDRFALVNGKEVSVWKRSGALSFVLEERVTGVKSWLSYGPYVNFVAKVDNSWRAYLADAIGTLSRQVPSQDSFLVREGSGTVVYEVTSGELLERPSLKQASHKKIWDIGYLREVPAGSRMIVQRWVDGESVVEGVAGPDFKFQHLGVLPSQWWIKSIVEDSHGGLRFVVEADKTWYLCQKGKD